LRWRGGIALAAILVASAAAVDPYFFRYKMTESCVQEIKLPNPTLKSFVGEVESKHGKILSLSELYALDQKLGNEIILVRSMKFGPKEQEVRFKSSWMLYDVSCLTSHQCLEGIALH
jgi:hypothetical protein